MKKKRVLVTGAGGSPSANFIRSLRKSPEEFHIVGTDADKYYLMRAETDSRYLVPLAKDPQFIDALNHIIEKEGIEFVHAQNDVEVNFLSENREKINAKTFFPAKETVKLCQDKFLSFQKWQDAGLRVPETVMLHVEEDLEKAFEHFGGRMWLRAITGAGGRGSLPVTDLKTAKTWMEFQKGWGSFTAAELLEPNSITWMSMWKDGELIVAQGRKRLYWELAKISPSGITGATGAGVTISDEKLDDIALRTIKAIDSKPDGLFAVDLTFDSDGVPNPTEINIGRFFTTHQFFTELGVNMPYMFVKLAYGEEPPKLEKKINPAPDGMVWIRGMDFEPVLVSEKEIEQTVTDLEKLRKELA